MPIIFTNQYIQNCPTTRFINRWNGYSYRAMFQEPATLIFYGTAASTKLLVGALLRDMATFNTPPPANTKTPKQTLWEVVAIEEFADRSTDPPTWNTYAYCRKTTPPSAPGSINRTIPY